MKNVLIVVRNKFVINGVIMNEFLIFWIENYDDIVRNDRENVFLFFYV